MVGCAPYPTSAVGVIEHGVNGFSGCALEHGEVFGSTKHIPTGVVVSPGIVGREDLAVVGHGGDETALSVNTSRSCLANHLGLAVTIEVEDEELRVMCSCSDVPAQVDTPETRAVEFVAIDVYITGIATL